jgi:flagella basal body P-ring formation protein FlgA
MTALILFILTFSTVFACEFELPSNLVIFNNGFIDQEIIKSKNCSNQSQTDMANFIKGFDGRVAAFQIQELMATKGHHQISVNPQSIFVQQFKTLVREQINLPQGIQIKEAQLQNQKNFLILNPGDQLEISCNSCLYGSRQPLNLNIKGFDGINTSHLVTADFVKMVKAFKLLAPMPAFTSFDHHQQVQEIYTESIPHTDFNLERDHLKFYKTNKPLKAGEILKISDLTAINLVKAGLKTDVIIENKMIRIKTQGISRQNGAIGEFVEVFQPQKNKKYQGRVVDNNKILVEL